MSVPTEKEERAAALRTGFRWQLDRAIQINAYLRVLFSTVLLLYAVFGPAVLLRFPTSAGGVGFDSASRFYAFRPVLFALGFAAMFAVLGVLARRGFELFEAALFTDTTESTTVVERDHYIRLLLPGPLPFLLSGQRVVDILILVMVLVAYAFWVMFLVATVPPGMGGYGIAGVVLGSYGLFAAVIITGLIWCGIAARARRLRRPAQAIESETVRPVAVDD